MSTPGPWRKSSRSQNDSDCVEISHDLRHIRDSKDPSGPVLPVDVRVLVRAIRAGRFHR